MKNIGVNNLDTLSAEDREAIDRANRRDLDLQTAMGKIVTVKTVTLEEAKEKLENQREDWIVLQLTNNPGEGWRVHMGQIPQQDDQ